MVCPEVVSINGFGSCLYFFFFFCFCRHKQFDGLKVSFTTPPVPLATTGKADEYSQNYFFCMFGIEHTRKKVSASLFPSKQMKNMMDVLNTSHKSGVGNPVSTPFLQQKNAATHELHIF